MATYYSSFFNSGLRATDSDLPSRPNPTDPATPRAFKTSFDDTTPKSDGFSMPASASSNNVLPSLLSQVTDPIPTSANANRPHMRRRRSSLSLSASPVTALKSAPSIPRASVNLQRNSIGVVTANRVRSGSITDLLSRAAMTANANSDATNANSLMGRLRSGSVGTSLRSTSRRLRKQASVPAPAPPPPTSPLPEVPQLTITTNTTGMSSRPVTPRPKFGGRAHTTESIPIVVNTPGRDDTMLSSPLGARGFAHSEGGEAMDTDDYPTPLETPGEVQGDSYF